MFRRIPRFLSGGGGALLALTLTTLAIAPARAQGGGGPTADTLGVYRFTGAAGNEVTFPVTSHVSDADFSPMRRGSGVTPTAGANAFVGGNWSQTAGAIDTADYFAFRVTASAGHALDLDTLGLRERRSNTGIRHWELRSSLDGFAAPVFATGVPDTNTTRSWQINLGPAFDAVSSVEFRLFGFEAEAAAGTWRVDDVFLLGAVNNVGPATPTVSFNSASVTVNESAGTIQIPVIITNPSPTTPTTVEVRLATPGGTATQGGDYTFVTQTITFPADSTSGTPAIMVIVDDVTIEADETVKLQLTNVSTGASVGLDSMTVLIQDNDANVQPIPPLVTIASVTGNNADGTAAQLGQPVRLRGIVSSPNLRMAGYQTTLIDNTGGIGLFRSASLGTQTMSVGDSLEVVGVITQFNGLTQVAVDSFRTLLGNQPLPVSPRVVTVLDETTESELVKIVGPLTIVTPAQWTNTGSGFTVDVTDGTTTYAMRVARGTDVYGSPPPTAPFSLVGIGGQFDATSPFDSGYQLMPRSLADIQTVTGLPTALPAATLALYPNPATTQLVVRSASAGQVTVLDARGQVVMRVPLTADAAFLEVSTLPVGVYAVRVGAQVRRFVKQ